MSEPDARQVLPRPRMGDIQPLARRERAIEKNDRHDSAVRADDLLTVLGEYHGEAFDQPW